jgi:hypothetical protein
MMEQDTGMKIRLIPEESKTLQYNWLMTGEVDVYGDGPSTTGVRAQESFATRGGGPGPLRWFWPQVVQYTGFIVAADSGIKSLADIKPGIRIATWPANVAVTDMFTAILEYCGLTWDDVQAVPFGGYPQFAVSVKEGKADLTHVMTTASYAYEAAAGPHGVRFLDFPIDDARFREIYLRYSPGSLFGTCDMGVQEAIGVRMPMSVFAFQVREDADPELTYNMAKWLDENYDRYKGSSLMCESMSLKNTKLMIEQHWCPPHEGLIKYLKEKGEWAPEYDAIVEFNVNRLNMYIDAYKAAIDEADAKGIKVDPQNEEWTKLWQNYLKDLPSLALVAPGQ